MVQHLHLELDLDPAEPIAGTLTGDDGVERSFIGWLDLLALLHGVCTAARAEWEAGAPGEEADP